MTESVRTIVGIRLAIFRGIDGRNKAVVGHEQHPVRVDT